MYAILKNLHVLCVATSLTLFVLRGLWMVRHPRLPDARWTRILPHWVDTLLLASALSLLITGPIQPFAQPWLVAKLVALPVYIALGFVALHRGRSRRGRLLAWLAALVVFSYMVAVAISKQPLPLYLPAGAQGAGPLPLLS